MRDVVSQIVPGTGPAVGRPAGGPAFGRRRVRAIPLTRWAVLAALFLVHAPGITADAAPAGPDVAAAAKPDDAVAAEKSEAAAAPLCPPAAKPTQARKSARKGKRGKARKAVVAKTSGAAVAVDANVDRTKPAAASRSRAGEGITATATDIPSSPQSPEPYLAAAVPPLDFDPAFATGAVADPERNIVVPVCPPCPRYAAPPAHDTVPVFAYPRPYGWAPGYGYRPLPAAPWVYGPAYAARYRLPAYRYAAYPATPYGTTYPAYPAMGDYRWYPWTGPDPGWPERHAYGNPYLYYGYAPAPHPWQLYRAPDWNPYDAPWLDGAPAPWAAPVWRGPPPRWYGNPWVPRYGPTDPRWW